MKERKRMLDTQATGRREKSGERDRRRRECMLDGHDVWMYGCVDGCVGMDGVV